MPDFETWMREIDKILLSDIGVCHDDLPDQNYYDMWQDGFTPDEVVLEVLLEELLDGGTA